MLKTQDFLQTGYYEVDNVRYNIQELTCDDLRIHLEPVDSFISAALVGLKNTPIAVVV